MPPDDDCIGAAVYECRNVRYLADIGVDVFSPPIRALVAASSTGDHSIVPSEAALSLQAMEVAIGSWSAERAGCADDAVPVAVQPATAGPCGLAGGWYYDTLEGESTFQHLDVLRVLDVLFKPAAEGGVGLVGIFSDFPATVSAYINCIAQR